MPFHDRTRKKEPRKIGSAISELLTRRGYTQIQSSNTVIELWEKIVGSSIARCSRPGNCRRGVLEVVVGNSTILQELTFRKSNLIAALSEHFPDKRVTDMRFRVGSLD